MPFTDVLNEIVSKVPKSLGAIIVDSEGECVQLTSNMDEHELKVIGAYQVIHFGNIKKKHHTTETFITKADDIDVISMRLDDEYFISLVIDKGSILGRAEYILKSKLKEIKDIM